jgi:xanthine permease XanP
MSEAADLTYGLEDVPPYSVLITLALQHIFLMSSTLVLPVVLVTEIGGDDQQVQAVLAMTMIACGLGTMVQGARWRGIGSGYLCPNLCGPNFFAASVGAAWLGGLPLMRGMTIVAGVVEVLFGRLTHRLAFLFPAEITGLVVFMVAFGLVPLGTSKFLGVDYAGDPINPRSFMTAVLTLLVMVGINVWGSKQLKLYAMLIGLGAGFLLSTVLGVLRATEFHKVAEASWVGLPHYQGILDISFRWSLVPVFVIVSICGALKSFGNLVLCEKANDPNWEQPDIDRIGDGLVADGLAVVASGLLGGVASDTSASNVTLSIVSGATRRGRLILHPRIFAQIDRCFVHHSRARGWRGLGVGRLLHDSVWHPDHPALACRRAQDVRHRHGADVWNKPRCDAGALCACPRLDAAPV